VWPHSEGQRQVWSIIDSSITLKTAQNLKRGLIPYQDSMTEYYCGDISLCQRIIIIIIILTQYALRVLRAHGLSDSGLHTVFWSVVVAKIMYASSAWSGFVNKQDLQRIDARSCDVARNVDSAHQIFLHSKNYEMLQTNITIRQNPIQQKPPSLLPTTATFGCITDLQPPKKTA